METINGTVERIVYEDSDSGYKVMRLREDGTGHIITVTGHFPYVVVGLLLEVKGSFSVSKYGEQFQGTSYVEKSPTTIKGIEKYLSSGFIKGIGATYGKRIVDRFKEDTLWILENEPERLREIEGIGEKRYQQIVESYEVGKEIKEVMIFLQGHGVSATYAMKIYKAYGKESISLVSENPYRLADDIYGIGFHIADNIAAEMGFERESLSRIVAGIRYILIQNSTRGHVYMEKEALLAEGETTLGVYQELVEDGLLKMIHGGDAILEEGDLVYLPSLHTCENGIVKSLESLLTVEKYTVNEREQVVAETIRKTKMTYSDEQKGAILTALSEKVMILTGGPGTGKTTVTLGIIKALESIHQNVVLAAPTGRAAKRLSELTGKEAKTIHRLLEYSPQEGFMRDEENPLKGDVFIIDESSMIDCVLLYHLLKGIPKRASIIFVGDVDQLPSVGPGNVLKDMIDSELIATVYLTEIFRQGKESRIITNAHRINKGVFPDLGNEESSDFFYFKEQNKDRIFTLIESLVKKRLPEKYNVDPVNDIQLLVPVKKGPVSTRTLNQMLQNALNPSGKGISFGEVIYRVGDKVMQIKNNYDKKIFNGDIGRVTEVDEEDRSLVVKYDDEMVFYEYAELDEIQLAYAVTIHKSQGSEYPVVIMPLVPQHYMMLQKNLLYTGVTRAKKLLILIAPDRAIHIALGRDGIEARNTKLKDRLCAMAATYQ